MRDLRQVITRGLARFSADALEALPELLAPDGGRAPTQVVRRRLLEFLMTDDPDRSADANPETLSRDTNVRLSLFRATKQLKDESVLRARGDAGEYQRPEHPLASESVRADGGLENRVVKELSEEIAAACAAAPRPRTERRNRQTPRPRAAGTAPAQLRGFTPKEVQRGFWWRESTADAIERLAGLQPLTIFAGADGASDVGPPVHRDLLAGVLRARLLEHEAIAALPEARRRSVATDVVDALGQVCMASQLGSIIRGLDRRHVGNDVPLHEEIALYRALDRGINEERSTDGFVADAILELAFCAHAGGRDVEIVTTHFDSDILRRQDVVRARTGWSGVGLRDYADGIPPDDGRPEGIPLMRIHGGLGDHSQQRLIVGEADFFAEEAVEPREHNPAHVSRPAVVERALARGDVLFVGTSLTDPGVLSIVAASRNEPASRYALLMPPDLGASGLTAHSRPTEYALALDLLAGRYLHLGVVPIIVDFEQQIPQVLREVANHIELGADGYVSYADRLDLWWDDRFELFGYAKDGTGPGRVARDVRDRWRQLLGRIGDQIRARHSHLAHASDEEIRLEAWLRNHHARTLFQLATTAKRQRSASEPLRTQELDDPAPTPERHAFRQGRTVARRQGGGYVIATPIVLEDPPWHHLPLGVVTVTADRHDGLLAAIGAEPDALRAFSAAIAARLAEFLALPDG